MAEHEYAEPYIRQPNPPVTPRYDTEGPPPEQPYSGKAKLDISPASPHEDTKSLGDISNPKALDVAPHLHPLEQHFERDKVLRHPLGKGIPKNHPLLTEN